MFLLEDDTRSKAERTRQRILDAAFLHFATLGFHGTGLNDILATAGISKGALYHHFPGKEAILHAVIEERIAPQIHRLWLEPLSESPDPVSTLGLILKQLPYSIPRQPIMGSPLSLLAQETALDHLSTSRLIRQVYDQWQQAITDCLSPLTLPLPAPQLAKLVIVSIEGALADCRLRQSIQPLEQACLGLRDYLYSLGVPV